MSITVLRQSATLEGFEPQGSPARPLTLPPCAFSGIDVDLHGAGDNRSGLWECTPGRFERQLANAEVMHILAGACTFTPTGGEPLAIRAGDTLFFPSNTTGEWHVTQTLRKVFVVLVG
ncbi:cupin domain-containing protein [Acidovorax sp. SUPP3334]|uniref:cupin domain-containing protein n=1 Tax=Acidovorax sp. SUPP3334 TaxID=2920881 RepID=UPI0023DE27C3|nr:cupin domain-containing protein [Acidovorax sp. SUPP3334]GKT23012.1 cupin domain-containing protein [Acidovorax sp. SUPP3334]